MDNDPTGNCGPPPHDIVKVLFTRAKQSLPRPNWNSLTDIWGRSRNPYSDQATGWKPVNEGSIPGRDKVFFFFTQCPDRLWVSHSFIPNGYIRHVPEGELARAWSWPLIIYWRVQRNSGAIPSFRHFEGTFQRVNWPEREAGHSSSTGEFKEIVELYLNSAILSLLPAHGQFYLW